MLAPLSKSGGAYLVPAAALVAASALAGCAVSSTSTAALAPAPQPVEVRMTPTVIYAGQRTVVTVRSPGADSIALESATGLDRYWSTESVLTVALGAEFGDAVPYERYAPRYRDRTLSHLKVPARVTTCRLGRCREFYHELTVKLPERNERQVAVTAGWSSVFARRTIRGGNRTVLLEEALTSGVWSLQGEWAAGKWNGKVQGFLGADDRGASLDLSRLIKSGDGLSYGLAMHAGVTRSDWMEIGTGAVPRHFVE